MRILITGAAGNLGSILTHHLLAHSAHQLRLMIHRRAVSQRVQQSSQTEVVRADLSDPKSLPPVVRGVDAIVHFAGVLFKARPQKFLHQTNTQYFEHLASAATAVGVEKIILISFPHVEGPTSIKQPARGRLDAEPISVHAQTRLAEERILFDTAESPLSLRVGMVYGDGVLMIDTARWLARRCLLGVWRERTQIHLISKLDFCRAVTAAIESPSARGIYHIGDDGNDSLQAFLRVACEQWGTKPPWKMPLWTIYTAAWVCEVWSAVFSTRALLTGDFVDIGRVSYYGDTSRMKAELIDTLRYPTLQEGKSTLG